MSDRATLKGYFNTGDVPTEAQFADLIDSLATTGEVSAKQDIVSGVSATEIGYLDGVTSSIQTQLNAKQDVVANVSSTEIGYLDGVTSAIQTQLNNKQDVVAGVSSTEIGYLDGVTSAIQTQLNAKQGSLVSGTNIKTVRTVSLLGSGDVAFNTVHVVSITFDVPASAQVGDLVVVTSESNRLYRISAVSPSRVYQAVSADPISHSHFATSILYTETAMAALEISTSASINTKSISTDVTMTFSAAPAAGTMFALEVTNTDTNPHTVTIPSSYSYARQTSITSFVVPASGRAEVAWRYDGSGYVIYGDPVSTTGSGDYVLATSPTLVTPALGTPASGTLTNCTGLPTGGLVDDAVTYAKMQNVSAASKLLGRGDSGSGDVQEITLGSGLSMSGATLSTTGGSASDMLSVLTSSEISVTGATTLTIGRMHVCSGTSADYTVTLPAASGNAGKFIGVRMARGLTKLVTVDGNSTELIDGEQTRVMWASESAILLSDGTGWTKIAGRSITLRARFGVTGTPGAGSQSLTNVAPTKIDVDTIDAQSLDMANTTSNEITIKRSGSYRITAAITYYEVPVTSNNMQVKVYKNSSECAGMSASAVQYAFPTILTTATVFFSSGDTASLYSYHNTGSSTQKLYVEGQTGLNYLEVVEVIGW